MIPGAGRGTSGVSAGLHLFRRRAGPKMGSMDTAHDDLGQAARQDRQAFRRAFLVAFGFVLLLWWIKGLELLFGESLHALGVRPHDVAGLIGVLLAPLIHGSIEHVLANSLPMIVMGTLALYTYPKATRWAVPIMWISGGLGTWLVGRDSFHFGASGLAYGLMFFVFLMGALRWDRRSIAVACAVFLLYGSMLVTVLREEPGVSWETHLFGALGGALAAILFRKLDPKPAEKRYDWEDEDDGDAPWPDSPEAHRAAEERAQYELPRPAEVPVLWKRPEREEGASNVIPFRGTRGAKPSIDQEPPTQTRH